MGAELTSLLCGYEGSALTDRRWLHQDERGSIVAQSDGSGVGSSYNYGPYGEQPSWSGSRFRYTGQIMLPGVQLYHYKARVYDPGIGRFLQTDPIGYKDDLNLYAYVAGDPLDRSDPTGTEWGGFSMGLVPEVNPPTAREFAELVVPGVAAYGEYEKGNYIFATGLVTLDAVTLGKGQAVSAVGRSAARTIGRIANRLNVINARHFAAALREARGEIVALRPDGKPFDHIGELREAAAGLKTDVLNAKNLNLLKKVDNIKADCPTGTRICQ